jgi:membrane dipeptidase
VTDLQTRSDKDFSRTVHDGAVLIDGRDPTFLLYRQTGAEKPIYWDAIRRSGLTAVTVDVPHVEDSFRDAAINFAAWHERVRGQADARIVRSSQDIHGAKRAGGTGFILSSQSPTPIENDLRLLGALYEMGLRVMEMSYQKRNLLADGCGESNDAGLSNFGKDAVREMNRLGVAIDLSHTSDQTMIQTIELSSSPVFFSHSNARAVVDHPRNVPDEYLVALAERDGVCCVSAYSDFLRPSGSTTGTTLTDYLHMVDYVVELIGIDHVGMGFDVGEARSEAEVGMIGGADPSKRYVKELRSRSDLLLLTTALLEHGYSPTDAQKILGGNLLRFYSEAWNEGATA